MTHAHTPDCIGIELPDVYDGISLWACSDGEIRNRWDPAELPGATWRRERAEVYAEAMRGERDRTWADAATLMRSEVHKCEQDPRWDPCRMRIAEMTIRTVIEGPERPLTNDERAIVERDMDKWRCQP